MKTVFKSAAAALLALAAIPTAHAAWSSDAHIAVSEGFAAGGTTDAMVSTLAPFIAKHLGDNASLVVMNRPGASGEIAINQVMRVKPNGNSLVVTNLPGYFFVSMYRNSFYATSDLTLLARVVSDPTVIVSRTDGKVCDLRQALNALKASPSSLSAGHNGVGTNGHLAMVRLEAAASVKFNALPFNGGALQNIALASNSLDIAFVATSEVPDPDNEATSARLLAQFTRTKVHQLASVPTTFDLDLPVEMTDERGFAAPNGVPQATMARIEKAIEAAMRDPDYIKAARNDAPFLPFLGGADWTRQIDHERKTYEAIAQTFPKE